MTLHQRRISGTAAIFGALLVLAACGRSGSTVPTPINTNPFTTIPTTNTGGTVTTPLPPSTGDTGGGNTTTPPDPSVPQSFSCSISLVGGTPTAMQAPATPVQVQYLVAVTPAVSGITLQPQISTNPASSLTVTQLMPSGSQVTVTGNFVRAGSITVMSTMNISGQTVSCQTVTTVTQGAPSTLGVYRFDRLSPPDIFYATSPAGPVNYRPAGKMFNVYTSQPPAQFCNAIELNQCLLPRSPNSVTFLTQAAGCGGYPVVARLGYSCSTQVTGTTPLYRMTNNIDFRYFATASVADVQALIGQGWRYEGIIGFVPLQ